ncbi:hypothetical protein BsWGS_06954 [Bradybaena similaris]
MYNSLENKMSEKRYPNVSIVEYQEIWRNHKSVEEEAACGFFDRFRKDPGEKKEDPLGAEEDKEKKPPASDKDKDKDKYPPIVTIDGRVDTDIDHLIEDISDEYKGPVDEVPSKFPKPHVFSVIEGSLDDDVDSYANDDGTMEHTLVDVPKSFNPKDLKDVASNDSPRNPGHSKSGQMAASHTDRSHNKMYVESLDNDGELDEPGREELRHHLQISSSRERLQIGRAHQRRQIEFTCRQDEKVAVVSGRQSVVRHVGRDQTGEGAEGKQRNQEVSSTGNGSSCFINNQGQGQGQGQGQSAKSVKKSESAEGCKYQSLEAVADAFNSRTVVVTHCDSSVYAAEVRNCSSCRDTRLKDTESAGCMQAYTESLTCTFTDESFREGHASLDVSTQRADPDQSQSLTESESGSDLQLTSARHRVRPAQVCASYDYNLETKMGPDFEHRLYHFPSYSDDSLTKSSELYHRSRYMTHSTSHVSASQAEPGCNQAEPSSDPTNCSVSSGRPQSAIVPGCNSGSSQNREEVARTVEDSVDTNIKYKPTGKAENAYPLTGTAYLQDLPKHTAYLENIPAPSAYLENTPAPNVYLEGVPAHTEGARRIYSRVSRRSDTGRLFATEHSQPPVEHRIAREPCNPDTRAKEVSAREERKPLQKLSGESRVVARELEWQLASLDPSAVLDKLNCPRSQSQPVAVGTPKEYRSTSTQNEITRDENTSRFRDLGIQVTLQDHETREVESSRELIKAHKPTSEARPHRDVTRNDSGTVDTTRQFYIQAERFTGDVSDSESLDSEANYLLHQLQMAQMTKRKANSLLKHVQSILEQTDQVEARQTSLKREAEDNRTATSTEADRAAQPNTVDRRQQELALRRSPIITSICVAWEGDPRDTVRDLGLNKSPESEYKVSDSSRLEGSDRGLVQTLVSTWDKHHRQETHNKPATKVTGPPRAQRKVVTVNKCSTKQTNGFKENPDSVNKSDCHRRRNPAVAALEQLNNKLAAEQTAEKRSDSQTCQDREQRTRGNSFDACHRLHSDARTQPIAGPTTHSTNAAYESTSPASVSTESVCDNKQPPGGPHESSRYAHVDAVDKRGTSLPRKLRLRRRSSPDAQSCKDTLKSKWRPDVYVKRIKARSSSIKDSLRVAFKVAEESMTAAARVAEALNIVMKASLISPPSSSSVEEKYIGPLGRDRPVVGRSNRLDPETAISRSKAKPGAGQPPSPHDVSQCPPSEHQASGSSKARKLDRICDRTDKKKRSSHSCSMSQERPFAHKTSLSSPLWRDTLSRKPRIGRASNHQLVTEPLAWESREAHSKSSMTLTDYIPQACGDSTSLGKHVPGQVLDDKQVVVQVAFNHPSECTAAQLQAPDSKIQATDASLLTAPLKDDQGLARLDTPVGHPSGATEDQAKTGVQECELVAEAAAPKPRSLGRSNGHDSPVVSECELSSRLMLSREEWTIPTSHCSSARKTDGYFTQKPPLIDQNLASISLSAKQIIRRQVAGSCVDPGCTDSAGSDSLESNSNFNRSTAGKQLHRNMAQQVEQQQRQLRLNKFIMSKRREEVELSHNSDPLIIWQCDASLQYEAECYPTDRNVFLQPDRGKRTADLRSSCHRPQPQYHRVTRSHEESNTSQRATVHVQDGLRSSYQLHEEEILQIEDYFESSCRNQEPNPCVATLCYTDLSSPVSSCFNLQDYPHIRPARPEQLTTPYTLEAAVSRRPELDRNYPLQKISPKLDRNYPLPKIIPENLQPRLDGKDMLECPHDDHQGQTNPAPKPRTRKLPQSDNDSFPLPGRAAQITRFSPIFEELCPEEVACSHGGAHQICPHLKGRSQSDDEDNSNNNGTNDTGADIWRTVRRTHTKDTREASAASWQACAAGTVSSSHEKTARRSAALSVPNGWRVGDEPSDAGSPGTLASPSWVGNLRAGGSVCRGCAYMPELRLRRTPAGVHTLVLGCRLANSRRIQRCPTFIGPRK